MLELAEYQVIEDSFEWIVLFRVSDKGDWLRWKTPKLQEQELELPCRFKNPAGESVISEERISSRRMGQIHAG